VPQAARAAAATIAARARDFFIFDSLMNEKNIFHFFDGNSPGAATFDWRR
jgi:hypothetical protein